MIPEIEKGMQVAREKEKDIKEDWWVLLNFAYFQEENYAKVRDIQKTLLETWPKKRYWFSLAGAYTELGEDDNLIAAYDAAYTQGMLEKESEFVTMAQLYLQREVPYKAAKLLTEKMVNDLTFSEPGSAELEVFRMFKGTGIPTARKGPFRRARVTTGFCHRRGC